MATACSLRTPQRHCFDIFDGRAALWRHLAIFHSLVILLLLWAHSIGDHDEAAFMPMLLSPDVPLACLSMMMTMVATIWLTARKAFYL